MEFDIEFDIEFDFGFNIGGGSEPPYSRTPWFGLAVLWRGTVRELANWWFWNYLSNKCHKSN